MSVHDKLAINNRYKAMRLEAESQVRQLNEALKEKRDHKITISKYIIETNKGILNQRITDGTLHQSSTP